MAQTESQVQAQIEASILANPNLTYTDANNVTWNITNNTSIRSIWGLWTFIVATCNVLLQQLMDLYQVTIEAIVAGSAPASQLWLQAKMFAFQYSVSNPQIIQLINGVMQYPVVDPTLNIVTACSVFTDATNTVQVKFAISNPLQAATSQQIAAAQAYINEIGGAGIVYNVNSLSPDLIYIQAQIFYSGMYSSIINTSVFTAINNFLTQLSQTNFDGSLKMSDLENCIRSVAGVNDVLMQNVYIRRATDPAPVLSPTGFALIVNETVQQRIYNPDAISGTAGYYVSETTNLFTLADSLDFISQ